MLKNLEPSPVVTGIVLAGGKNLRLGRNKALEKVGGVTIIERVVSRLQPLIDQLIVVTASRPTELPVPSQTFFISDIYPESGPLGGIYTGLTVSKNFTNIVVACDMPFLNTALLHHMVALLPGADAVVPRLAEGMIQPLHSIYARDCLPAIKKLLDARQLAISTFLKDVKVHYIEQTECRRFDPELLSFFNINRQNDLDLALKLAEKE